jgi:hypothetical protein
MKCLLRALPYEPYSVPLFDGSVNASGIATGAATMTASDRSFSAELRLTTWRLCVHCYD